MKTIYSLCLCLLIQLSTLSECFSQNLMLKYTELNDISTFSVYKGRFVRIDKDLIRYRLYGRKYVQITYIKKIKRTELRMYAYFNLFEFRVTPAISIRKNI